MARVKSNLDRAGFDREVEELVEWVAGYGGDVDDGAFRKATFELVWRARKVLGLKRLPDVPAGLELLDVAECLTGGSIARLLAGRFPRLPGAVVLNRDASFDLG